jgi:hypothetical protein
VFALPEIKVSGNGHQSITRNHGLSNHHFLSRGFRNRGYSKLTFPESIMFALPETGFQEMGLFYFRKP